RECAPQLATDDREDDLRSNHGGRVELAECQSLLVIVSNRRLRHAFLRQQERRRAERRITGRSVHEVQLEYEIVPDRLSEGDTVRLPDCAVGEDDPLDALVRGVANRLPEMVVPESLPIAFTSMRYLS